MTIVEIKRNNFETLSTYSDIKLANWMLEFYAKYYPEDSIQKEVQGTILDLLEEYNVPDNRVDEFRTIYNKYIWAYSPREEAGFMAAHDMHLV